LLDRHMQPVPLGVVGELYVGGAGVAQGYLNRAELTAERFITAPALFAAHHSAIGNRQSAIYKTGDLARRLPNGDLEYLGRADQQVKLRGFRIELGDIEAALARHPSVREAVVLLRDERLVAYVVLQEPRTQNQEPASAQHGSWFSVLGSFLKEKLPDYMVPSAFVELAAFPLTTNGKLDRTALPAPTGERTSAAAYTPPATVVEQTLAAIWAALLRVEQVGRDDNFFALGGDSILSMQVVARAAAAGIRIAPRHLFQYPTLAGLASVATSVGASATPKENDSGPIPLTPIQRWFFMQHRHEPQHWNTSIMLEVPPGLRADWLEAAVAQLVAHHAALRAVFATEPALPFDPSTSLRAGRLTNRVVEGSTEGTEMYMHISDTAAFSAVKPFAVVDVSETPNRKLKAAIESEAEAAQRSLNLAHGPLLRVLFFDAGERRNGRLLLVFHHLVIDGVSLRIVIGDLLTMYRQLSQGHTPQLPPASTPFPTWARRLASHARSPAVQRELDYWRNMAVALPPLPQDFPGGNSYGDTERVFAGLKPDETRALLTALPAATGTQPQEALLTALARTFQRWTGLPRLLVEMDVHGREDLFDDLDLSRSVGWFTAVYPLLLALAATEDRRPKTEANSQYAVRSSQFAVQTDLQQIKEQLRAVPNRGVGYGLLRYLGDDEARAALADIPQPAVSFNYLGQFDQPLAAADSDEPAMPFRVASESVGTEQHPHNQRAAQIYVVAIVAGGQLDMQWSYSGKQYKRATIERLAKWYLEELRGLLALTR
ncbi:MAG: condensation domain-containing protein, partial [Chloroflexaceae bacterium]|nr:condensation domain-containing protein [Chloroflexaceae bacterium]